MSRCPACGMAFSEMTQVDGEYQHSRAQCNSHAQGSSRGVASSRSRSSRAPNAADTINKTRVIGDLRSAISAVRWYRNAMRLGTDDLAGDIDLGRCPAANETIRGIMRRASDFSDFLAGEIRSLESELSNVSTQVEGMISTGFSGASQTPVPAPARGDDDDEEEEDEEEEYYEDDDDDDDY